MGTSLSGLTPATTFDGLLKVGDNDPLTANLKAISDGSGNDSAIQLSTGELKVIGQFNLDSDTAATTINLRGDSLSINQIYQANNVTYNSIVLLNSSGIRLNNGTGTALLARGGNVGIGGITATPSARLQVKGSGTTSATTSLLVQNSAGGNVFSITDDGFFTFNDPGGSDALTIENGNNNSKIRYNDNLWLGSSHGTYVPTLKIDRTAGLSVETTGGSLLNLLYDTGNLGIGETTPTARLHVKGSGNDNTTTSLLVQNSAGTDLLNVTDDGFINTHQRLTVNHPTNSLRSLRLGWGSLHATDNASELNIGAVYSEPTAPKIVLSGKTRASGADAIQVQTLNGMYIAPTANTEDPSAQLHIKGSGNDNTTTALLVQNSDGANLFKVDDSGIGVLVNDDQAGFIRLSASGEYGNIGGGRILRITSGGANPLMISGSGSNGVVIGSTSATTLAANTALAVKGQGATSATTALLVQNSAGTEHFKIDDVGVTSITSASQSVPLFVNASGSATAGIELRALSARRFRILATSTITTLETTNTKGISTNASLNVGSGYTGADASAVLQADSTTQGFLPPRMTTTERDAITTPAAGLMVYNTTTNKAQCYNGTTWNDLF